MEFARDARDLARYAAIFAADAGTDALYYKDRYTEEMADMCVDVALEAIKRRDAASEAGEDFYACAFVEAAASQCHHFAAQKGRGGCPCIHPPTGRLTIMHIVLFLAFCILLTGLLSANEHDWWD